MKEILTINWKGFDLNSGLIITIGLLIMLFLADATGQPWMTTALAALFAWLTAIPGPLKERISGMLAFAAAAILITLVSGAIELAVWPSIAAIAVIGFLGSYALTWGMRAFMVGFTAICWGIYGPFLVASSSVQNVVLAIVTGTAIVIVLTIISDKIRSSRQVAEATAETAPEVAAADPADAGPPQSYITAYAITVAVVLALSMYTGAVALKTDPTLIAGAAFFVIGFEARKTVISGVARLIGLVAGAFIGLLLADAIGAGPVLDTVMLVAIGLSFATPGMHPGAWMFFFMIFGAIGWNSLDPEAFNLTVGEKLYGEIAGVVAAMVAIAFLQWFQGRKAD